MGWASWSIIQNCSPTLSPATFVGSDLRWQSPWSVPTLMTSASGRRGSPTKLWSAMMEVHAHIHLETRRGSSPRDLNTWFTPWTKTKCPQLCSLFPPTLSSCLPKSLTRAKMLLDGTQTRKPLLWKPEVRVHDERTFHPESWMWLFPSWKTRRKQALLVGIMSHLIFSLK